MASKRRNSVKSIQKPIRAIWTTATHELFVGLCVEQTLKGNKPGTHFTREGRRNIDMLVYE
ncbi:unnamed protein product, partial [Ilex paraguariensis]